MRLIAMPKCPYRPDRPMRCKYVSECLGKSKLMTTFTAWISMPRVNKSNTQKQHTENHLTKHINKKTKQLIWACTIRALCWNDSSIRTLRESPLIQRWFSMGFPRPKIRKSITYRHWIGDSCALTVHNWWRQQIGHLLKVIARCPWLSVI